MRTTSELLPAPRWKTARDGAQPDVELVAKLPAWRHPGFSAHVGEPIAPEEKQGLEDTAATWRNPLSLKKLVYLDAKKAVLYRSRMNPFLGRNFEAMDPLEWLARLSDHIPDPGQHRVVCRPGRGCSPKCIRRTLCCAPLAASGSVSWFS
jgi:hypothetical protein